MRGHRTRKGKIVIFLVATVIASGTRLFADILYGGDVIPIPQARYSASGEYRVVWAFSNFEYFLMHQQLVNGTWTNRGYVLDVIIHASLASPPAGVYMQTDGNFVAYDDLWTPVAASDTYGNPGAYLNIQDDGNVVNYSTSGTALWSMGCTLFPYQTFRYPIPPNGCP